MNVSVRRLQVSSRAGSRAVGLVVVLVLSIVPLFAHAEETKAPLKTGHALLLNAHDQQDNSLEHRRRRFAHSS